MSSDLLGGGVRESRSVQEAGVVRQALPMNDWETRALAAEKALEEAEAEIERQHLYRGALRVDLTEAEAERDAYKQRYEEWESTDEECPHRASLDTAKGHIAELLLGGQHDGPCTNESTPYDDACDLHIAAANARKERARAFLADGPNTLKPGTVMRHISGGTCILSHRKDDDSGWWNTDGSGLADRVIEGDDWSVADGPNTEETDATTRCARY